jgi:hypothetical protein
MFRYFTLHIMTEPSKQTYMLHISLLCKNLIDMIHCMFTLHTMTEHSKQTYMLKVKVQCIMSIRFLNNRLTCNI